MQDYLVCMTESMVSRAVYDIKDFMTEVCMYYLNCCRSFTDAWQLRQTCKSLATTWTR